MTSRGGSAATAPDREIFEAMDLLGATEGILTEPAGGTTIAATMKLANEGKLGPDDTVVAVISGNGYKTLDEHPDKPWPEMVACKVEAMERTLEGLRQAAPAPRRPTEPAQPRTWTITVRSRGRSSKSISTSCCQVPSASRAPITGTACDGPTSVARWWACELESWLSRLCS